MSYKKIRGKKPVVSQDDLTVQLRASIPGSYKDRMLKHAEKKEWNLSELIRDMYHVYFDHSDGEYSTGA